MTSLEPGHIITLVGMAVGALAWLLRLEGKVHKNSGNIDSMRDRLAGIEAKAGAEAKIAQETREALIRLEEQIKHLTDLVERLIPRRRGGAD